MTSAAERFAAKTERAENGCLRWTGAHNSRGYGCFAVDGVSQLAHRVAYEWNVGPIPEGLTIDHVAERGCIYKDCVEQTHLEAVTGAVNMGRSPRAVKTHCVHGHELTGANLMVKKRANGRTIRNCRTCNNEQAMVRDLLKSSGSSAVA